MNTSATIHYLPSDRPCQCRFVGDTRAHHDRLLTVLQDPDQMLDLMELAVTWGELDYSETPVIPPNRWLEFANSHIWTDGEKAERVMNLAVDIALGSARSSTRLAYAHS